MYNRIFSIIVAIATCLAASAQRTCVINGHIVDNQLAGGEKVKKVYLTHTNELGQVLTVATAKVKNGCYTFKYELDENEPVLQYVITGWGTAQGVELFIEDGEVIVNTPAAIHPEQSTVVGTPTNELYAEYKAIASNGYNSIIQQVAELEELHGKAWLETVEGKAEVKRVKAKEAIKTEAEALRFLIDHNASPMTPWVIEHSLFSKLSAAYAEQMTKTIAVSLHEHPYYYSLRNAMLASTLRVGSTAPDITLPLFSGETKHLNDYLGKYVILNFWSDREKASEMFAALESVYEMVQEQREQYVVISVSLEHDIPTWMKAVKDLSLDREGWLHACDGAGINSPAAKRYGVKDAPKIILIEPEGHAVSLDMEIDEIGMRIEQILSGDLYYLDMEK